MRATVDRAVETIAMQTDAAFHSALAARERYRDDYWHKYDPIAADRLLWRAQTFRHTVHLLPGQTILELGCGEGLFTHALLQASRGENRITTVTFQELARVPSDIRAQVELLGTSDLPGSLAGRHFDYVVAMDLLDLSCASQLLAIVHALLAPGGAMDQSFPWNGCLFIPSRARGRRLLACAAGHLAQTGIRGRAVPGSAPATFV